MPERTHPSWQIATDIGEEMAKDRQEAEKQAAKAIPYGKEHLEPMEMAKRFQEAGPEFRARMIADMRKEKGGMMQVKRFVEATNAVKRRTAPGPRPPQLRIGGRS